MNMQLIGQKQCKCWTNYKNMSF